MQSYPWAVLPVKVFQTLDPDKRLNLLVLFIAGFSFWTSLASLLPTLPAYIQDIGGTTQQVGIVMGSFALGLLLFRGLLGRMADQRSRKIVVMIGTAVVGLAPFCYLFVQSIPVLMVVRAFHGISVAAFTTGYNTLVVDLSPPQQRGELIGYMSLVAPIGLGLGPALGGYLAEAAGYTPMFVMAGGVGLIAFVAASQVREKRVQRVSPETNPETPPPLQQKFWVMLFSPRLRIPAAVMLMVGLVFGTLATFLPLYIRAVEIDFNPGLFYAIAAITSFISRLYTGRASDRLGRGIFISGSLLCYLISMILLATANSILSLILAAIVEGIAAGTVIPMMIALMSDRSATYERGKVYSICIGGFDVGIAIAGPVLGSVVGITGYRGIFFLAGFLATTALFLFATQSSKNLSHSVRFATGRERDVYALDLSQQ
jgi:MFS family permease